IDGGRPSISKYEKAIEAARNELLGEKDLMRRTNLKQTQIRVILADLIEQKIIREITINRSKKYEYIAGAPALNPKSFEELRSLKKTDLDHMIGYAETTGSRMKYLCDFLGDSDHRTYTNCDNTGQKKLSVMLSQEWIDKLQAYREVYFPELKVELKKSKLKDGIAGSYYGASNVGAAIHRSKYENGGDFPDFLLRLVLKAFRKKFGQEKFDLILYVPPTKSGELVKNFAVKVGQVLKIPVSHDLVKTRETSEQKIFENGYLKADNVKGAFAFANPDEIKGKSILLFDDIFDSGATIKEIGRYLTALGAEKIAPLVIARTVGGDLV
ncbi:MAG: RecQ family ATP-dependent DNA helicase, partial [Bacteroidales bacterium]|nr:RecQ family ATP-dependent DNA helicase [Bacteroidales bacterium]